MSEIAAGRPSRPGRSSDCDPFDTTLWGEYARMFLVASAVFSTAAWAACWVMEAVVLEPLVVVMVATNLLMIGVALGNHFAGVRRMGVLLLLLTVVLVTLTDKGDPTSWWSPLVMLSPVVTIGSLVLLVLRDGVIAMRTHAARVSPEKAFVIAAVLGITIYMIVMPTLEAFVQASEEQLQSYKIEEPTALELLRVRSAKFFVFAIFAYAGACVGSFLNVVAASAPRGEAIALRSSACPQCRTPIRRLDNLPIVSYMRLGGRCRDCAFQIPIRYFVVEVLGLAIFASLFLYELITGAANVPGFQHYSHAGILWIILYTKWPVVGVYFFHCILLSCVLMLALMEQDRLRAPRWMSVALPVAALCVVVASPAMLTVSLVDQTPLLLPASIPDWLDRVANSLAGGLFGWGLASLVKSFRLRHRQASSSVSLAFVLVGISLGWQAVVTIAVLWWVIFGVLKSIGGLWLRPRWLTATTLLFVVVALHHPVWSWTASLLSF